MSYYDKDRELLGVAKRIHSFPSPGLNSVGEFQQSGRPYVVQSVLSAVHEDGDDDSSTFAGDGVLVKGDDVTITFPFITKKIIVNNTSGAVMQVYFCSLLVPASDLAGADVDHAGVVLDPAPTARGNKLTSAELTAYEGDSDNRPDSAVLDNGHYYTVANGGTLELNVKCRRVYFAGASTTAFSVAAELTNIIHNYNCDLRGIDGISGGTVGSVLE